ncbi:MAG: hypothetical protein EPO68_13585 [Planctomycetota bacterium]|nr:MAG: hypothetical protein EPO68_13585 [Planctomycetota bacterium]
MRRGSLLVGTCARLLPPPVPAGAALARAFAALVLACALAACARDAEPVRAVSLVPALARQPAPLGVWTTWRGRELALVPDDTVGLWWLHCPFTDADWEPTQWRDVWSAPRPLPAIGQANLVGKSESLLISGLPAREISAGAALRDPARLVHGDYAAAGERVYLCSPRVALAQPIELVTPLRLWSGDAGESRVGANGVRGSGFSLLSGQAIATELAARGASELVFATTSIALPDPARAPNALHVRLDGASVHATQPSPAEQGLLQWHRVALPAIPARGARLEFELAGDPACVFVLVPELRPQRAVRADRAVARDPDARPDILLLLADTFRADLLTAYGAPSELAPGLERLARDATVFEHCWSASTWTLPAHASLFSGLLPSQHGAVSTTSAMPKEPRMLAEHLRALGYRTAAFTEGAYVSPEFGLSRGFDVFHAATRDVEQTVDAALAFLDTADERPLFVFVHSYRTHSPYHASDAARAALRDVLEIPASEQAVLEEHVERSRAAATPAELAAASAAYGRALAPLYRAGAWDLDRAFDRLIGEWDRRGFGRRGAIAFTSDHGEALGEHAQLGHGISVYDEVLRVPLLLRVRGRAPGRDAAPASLVDLPRTLSAIAGLEPWPGWTGRDLFTATSGAPAIHAFECAPGPDTRMAAIHDLLKLVVAGAEADKLDAQLLAAFDLRADPLELAPLLTASEARCRDAWSHARPPLELLVPAAPAAEAELDAALRHRLQDLGYLGK